MEHEDLPFPPEALISEIGEKELISRFLYPLFGLDNSISSIGDDCAVLIAGDLAFCASTDRVPADLIAYKLGLMTDYELGRYLTVLNISDCVVMGVLQGGVLLNLAIPNNTPFRTFQNYVLGAKDVGEKLGFPVIGGDLSVASERSLSATSIGYGQKNKLIRRQGTSAGDYVFCTKNIGTPAAAFAYYLSEKTGHNLKNETEAILKQSLCMPFPDIEFISSIQQQCVSISGMDNTDGIAQSFRELASLNEVSIVIDLNTLPISTATLEVSQLLGVNNPYEIALSAGADFQFVGSISHDQYNKLSVNTQSNVNIIGRVEEGNGIYLDDGEGNREKCNITGWNYFI